MKLIIITYTVLCFLLNIITFERLHGKVKLISNAPLNYIKIR